MRDIQNYGTPEKDKPKIRGSPESVSSYFEIEESDLQVLAPESSPQSARQSSQEAVQRDDENEFVVTQIQVCFQFCEKIQ